MRFLMISNPDPSAAPPDPERLAAIGQLTEEMTAAGVLVDTGGIQGVSVQVRYSAGKFTMTDGPFTEAKELVGGYAIVNAASMDEALALSRRFFEAAGDGTGEVRRLFGRDDLAPGCVPEQ